MPNVRDLSRVSVNQNKATFDNVGSNLAKLSIERDLSGSLDLDTVVDRFAAINQGRRLRLK